MRDMKAVLYVGFWIAPIVLWNNPMFWLLWAGLFLSFSLWKSRRYAR